MAPQAKSAPVTRNIKPDQKSCWLLIFMLKHLQAPDAAPTWAKF
jgi:hypothetical protein